MRVLIVEDEERLAAGLRIGLEAEGFAVDVAGNGVDGLWLAREEPYDAIVLDIMLPELGGYELCAALRAEECWTPILMLTARDAEMDEVRALDTGADDYLTKPFAHAVLVARLRALLRRGARERPTVLNAGDLRLDPAARRAWRGELEIDLTARELSLLEFLLRRRDEGRGGPRRHLAGRSRWARRDDHAGRSQGRGRLPPREHPRPGLRGSDGPRDQRDGGWADGSRGGCDPGRGAPDGRHDRAQDLRARLRRVPGGGAGRADHRCDRRTDRCGHDGPAVGPDFPEYRCTLPVLRGSGPPVVCPEHNLKRDGTVLGAARGRRDPFVPLWNRMRHAASPTDAEAIQASLADLRASAEAADLGTAGEQAAMLVELSGG